MILQRFLQDIKKYFRYSVVAARAMLKSEVANSYLNWLWWILDPVCFMLIYTFMFGYVFKAREPYFPVFIFIGLSMWDFFNRTITSSVKLVKNNKAIVSKVYIPKFILILTRMWVNGFKMLISFVIVIFMMAAYHVPPTWNILYFLPVIVMLGLFSFGCSCYLLHFGVWIEDLSNVTSIGLRFLFYMTGIFYDVASRIPAPYGGLLLKINPVAFFLESMRNALLYGKTPHRKLMVVWLFISLLISCLGVRKIYKNENSYVKVI